MPRFTLAPLFVLAAFAAALASEIAGLQSEADGLEAVVLGFPRRLNGEEHDQSRAVRAMADQLRRVVKVPLHLQDERLSSSEAEALLSRTEKDWRKRKLQLDAVAAAVILQDYLDSLARTSGSSSPNASSVSAAASSSRWTTTGLASAIDSIASIPYQPIRSWSTTTSAAA